MSNRGARIWVAGVALAAATLLAISLRLPLWQLRMEAPQYREQEALKVAVYPGAMRGDLDEIKTLNQYIGVHIPDKLPQLGWLPAALVTAGLLGAAAALLPLPGRRWALAIIPTLLACALVGSAIQAQWQMYDIGHRRDHKTKLVGVKDFNTPLLGTARIAQFDVASSLGWGAYLAGAAIALQFVGACLSGNRITGSSTDTLSRRERMPSAQQTTLPRPACASCQPSK
jgi:hypothetical protein